jgi:adenosylcobinamide-GDP ribazoletransferase
VRRALAFLTPFGGARVPDHRTLAWFPVAGAAIGGALGLVWWAAGRLWPPLVVAAVVVAADLALTGMLHVDGLVDSADGLLAHLAPDRRLEVMAEPTVGAFGVTVAVATMLLRYGAIAVLTPDVALVAAVWCASRTVMAVAASRLRYARSGGLASAFLGADRGALTALHGVPLAVGLALLAGAPAIAAVAAAFTVGAGVVAFGRARLGGFTGDVLGAAGYLGETAALLIGAARW